MTRPRYETEDDRKREALVGQRFANAFKGVTVVKLEQGARADFLATDSRGKTAYIEVKTRTCKSTQYATYHVSADKLKSLQSIGEKDGHDAILLVQWRDRTGYITVKKYLENATYKDGGRWDRNDPFDVEEMAEVDISLFRFLS